MTSARQTPEIATDTRGKSDATPHTLRAKDSVFVILLLLIVLPLTVTKRQGF
jgi:hypothetical protein